MRGASLEPLSVYVPMDRRQALVRGDTLPHRTRGAALCADISGFTPLTAALARELGLQRGAEELTRLLNQVYGALIAEVHRYGGSVIGFSGDAIVCWLGDDSQDLTGFRRTARSLPVRPGSDSAALRAVACGLAMQRAMAPFDTVQTPAGTVVLRHGEISDAAYFILEGRAVAGREEGGRDRVLEVLNAGDFFGEIAALTNIPRTANVIIEEPAKLLRVPATTLREMAGTPELNRAFVSKMTERMIRMNMVDLPRMATMDQQAMRELRTPEPQLAGETA